MTTEPPPTKHYVMRGNDVKIEQQDNGEWRVTYDGRKYAGEVFPSLDEAEDQPRKHCKRSPRDETPSKRNSGKRVTSPPQGNDAPSLRNDTPARNSYEMVPADTLVPAEYNPNILGPDAYNALVAEVREQGRLLKPIVVRECDGQHVIVDGHWTWLAAQDIGLQTVPVQIIEADEFEARRQTLIRNRTGKKDNLKLGRVYKEMLSERSLNNRELAGILGLSEGSIRNQLLYPEAWELLREKGKRGLTAAGEPAEPEAYLWGSTFWIEATITKMGVRDVRDLVARLQGLADEGEGTDKPGAAEPEARILARLKRAWAKATDDERRDFIEWTGVAAELASLIEDAKRRGFDEGHAFAKQAAVARAARNEPEAPRNGYAKKARRDKAPMPERASERLQTAIARFGWSQTELAKRAGTHPPIVSAINRGALERIGPATAARVLEIAERGP